MKKIRHSSLRLAFVYVFNTSFFFFFEYQTRSPCSKHINGKCKCPFPLGSRPTQLSLYIQLHIYTFENNRKSFLNGFIMVHACILHMNSLVELNHMQLTTTMIKHPMKLGTYYEN